MSIQDLYITDIKGEINPIKLFTSNFVVTYTIQMYWSWVILFKLEKTFGLKLSAVSHLFLYTSDSLDGSLESKVDNGSTEIFISKADDVNIETNNGKYLYIINEVK